MNTANNSKYQETENKIKEAFGRLAAKKDIEKITVSDICAEAHLHRTTFYGHYEDINALTVMIGYEQFQAFFDAFNKGGIWDFRTGMRYQVEFYKRYQEIIRKHIVTDSQTSNVRKSNFVQNNVLDKMGDQYKKAFHCENDTEFRYHQIFFSSGMNSVIEQWVIGGCKESVDDITNILCKIFGFDNHEKEYES
ncbi:MAG: TetR family transcriptional regulator C-terminal domain-containing protein [Lachnospiraceae bacterium]|nr:TetR family transcriptional regulator C-terminal domain-containing protein [Lachnospiraceae bacterium]